MKTFKHGFLFNENNGHLIVKNKTIGWKNVLSKGGGKYETQYNQKITFLVQGLDKILFNLTSS